MSFYNFFYTTIALNMGASFGFLFGLFTLVFGFLLVRICLEGALSLFMLRDALSQVAEEENKGLLVLYP